MQFKFLTKEHNYANSEKNIIAYIEQHPKEATQLSIQELAQKTFSSNATIIRLCHKVGCAGFKDFKLKLVQETELNRLTDNDVNFSFPFTPADSVDQIAKAMTDLYSNGLKLLYSHIDLNTVTNVARQLFYAHRFFVYGIGDSGLTARSFINKVNKLNIYPIFAYENNEALSNSAHIKDDDVAFFITYGDEHSSEYQQYLSLLKQNNCKITVLTANATSPLAQAADELIIIPDEEKDSKVATFYFQFAFQYVLNLLFSIIYKEKVL